MNSKRTVITLCIFVGFVLFSVREAAAEITMTLDRNQIDFRVMDPGETREVTDQGVYHNQISCTSTNDVTWYLKAQIIRPFTSGMHSIPNENFRWKVVSVGDGRGQVYNNVNTANPFTTYPGVIYTSADTDNTGTQVDIQLRYVLTVPRNQIAGHYDAVIRFTMIEIL